jgi:hypothetical protein
MKQKKDKRAMVISFTIHVIVLLLAIFPMISMINKDVIDPFENYQIIEIAFENGDMSPASASTQKGSPEVKIEEEVEEIEAESTESVSREEATVLKNEDLSFDEEVELEMEEGEMKDDIPIAEKESEKVESTEEISDIGGDELADEGEGEIGEAITGEALANMDFEGEGVFGRKIIYHANISKLAKEEGRVVVNLCINRAGIVTHIAFNKEASTISNPVYVRKVMTVAGKYRFEEDYTAPQTQCGKLSFIFEYN